LARSDTRNIVIVLSGILGFLLLVVTLMWLRSYFEVVRNRTVHRAVLSVENPKLKALRVREEEQLNSYGWVDEERGVVRIPIEQAMGLLVQEARESRGGEQED
jgi:hypothetical protein